jgi:hypothetical protein
MILIQEINRQRKLGTSIRQFKQATSTVDDPVKENRQLLHNQVIRLVISRRKKVTIHRRERRGR